LKFIIEYLKKSLIAKNIISVTISNIFVKFVSAFIVIAIARYFGATELGIYSSAINFVGLTSIFTQLGLRDNLIKHISIDSKNISEFIGTSIYIKLIISIIVFIISILIAHLLSYDKRIIEIVYVGGIALFLADFIEFLFAYYYGIQKMINITIFRCIYSVLTISSLFIALWLKEGILGITLINLFVNLFLCLLILYYISKEIKFTFNKNLVKTIIQESIPFALNSIFYVMYAKIGVVLLSFCVVPYYLGLYDSAFKVMTMLFVFPNVILTTMYPVLFKLGAKSNDEHIKTFYSTLYYITLICFPISAFLFVNSNETMLLIYGNSFSESHLILKILSLLLALQAISYPLADVLTTKNKQNIRTAIIGYIVVLTSILSFISLKIYGYFGIAYTTIFIEFILVFINLYFVNKEVYEVKILKVIYKPFLASIIMGVTIFYFKELVFNNIFLSVFIGSVLYFSLIFILSFNSVKKSVKKIERLLVAQSK